jgi:hypothetical protein
MTATFTLDPRADDWQWPAVNTQRGLMTSPVHLACGCDLLVVFNTTAANQGTGSPFLNEKGGASGSLGSLAGGAADVEGGVADGAGMGDAVPRAPAARNARLPD